MLRNLFLLFIPIVLGMGSCNSQPVIDCSQKDSLHWVTTSLGCLYFNLYKSDSISINPNLIFILHGDAPFNNPGYQYGMAKKVAKQMKNTITIGLLRPGYTDPDSNKSDGIRGEATGDNYTTENIDAISEVIARLKKVYQPKHVVLIGHSGGAAISANIISLKPGLIDKAILVSCPCDLDKWRQYMSTQQPDFLAWKKPVHSVSPISVANTIQKQTKVAVIIGEKDDVTPLALSIEYYNKLKEIGTKVNLIQVPDEGHELLFHDAVMKETTSTDF